MDAALTAFESSARQLVRDVLINSGLKYDHSSISSAIIKLAEAGLLKEIGDAAVQVIDDYLTAGNEDCRFSEPEFQKIRDLNAFLKSDKLGKGDEFSPKLRTQVTLAKKILRRNGSIEKIKAALATA